MTQQKYEAFYLRFMYNNKKQMLRLTGSLFRSHSTHTEKQTESLRSKFGQNVHQKLQKVNCQPASQ